MNKKVKKVKNKCLFLRLSVLAKRPGNNPWRNHVLFHFHEPLNTEKIRFFDIIFLIFSIFSRECFKKKSHKNHKKLTKNLKYELKYYKLCKFIKIWSNFASLTRGTPLKLKNFVKKTSKYMIWNLRFLFFGFRGLPFGMFELAKLVFFQSGTLVKDAKFDEIFINLRNF